MNNCEHENLKYYPNGNKVICLACGEAWGGIILSNFSSIPHTPPDVYAILCKTE